MLGIVNLIFSRISHLNINGQPSVLLSFRNKRNSSFAFQVVKNVPIWAINNMYFIVAMRSYKNILQTLHNVSYTDSFRLSDRQINNGSTQGKTRLCDVTRGENWEELRLTVTSSSRGNTLLQ